jgi:hypothetical protein
MNVGSFHSRYPAGVRPAFCEWEYDMAYDRYDERSRWSGDRFSERDRDWRGDDRHDEGRRDERGFLERAGDEVASWFGDDDAERRRREDRMMDERERGWDRDQDRERGWNAKGGVGAVDYNRNWRRDLWGSRDRDENRFRDRGRDYRPMTGDYGSSDRFSATGAAGMADEDRWRRDRSQSPWGRDEYRRTSRAGSSDWTDRSRHEDPHYDSWRQRHLNELDRDYEDYRRENQDRFERDFGSWREQRMHKRGMLGQIREHMEVVGNDDQHVGTVDRIAGDRIILTKSDPESGGAHHSLMCSDVDRIDGDRVILDCSADQARDRWRDESRSRALFEREDQGEMGPRMLDRSFEGTYRR